MKSVITKLETRVNGDFPLDANGILDNCKYNLANAMSKKLHMSLCSVLFNATNTTAKLMTSLHASL